MPASPRLPRDILETFLAQIETTPAGPGETVLFVRDGILKITRAAIAAEAELEALGRPAE